MNELMRLVLAPSKFLQWSKLFERVYDKSEDVRDAKYSELYADFFGKLTPVRVHSFDTWFNLFAAKKWAKYCDLGGIYLKLNIKGKYILQIFGTELNVAFTRIDTMILEKEISGEGEVQIPISNAAKYDGIFFKIIEDKNNPIEIISGAFCTDKAPNYDNKLAIVSCTFKREEYILRNIAVFEDFIKINHELKDKMHLYVIDNGKTLDINKSNTSVSIIPNMNAGGAGGFTRGLMEILKSDKDWTRVLFTDDDVEIFSESFYRTLIVANYLRQDYKNAFITGAMLDFYDKSMFFENISLQRDLWVSGYHQNIDVNNLNGILHTNNIPDYIFSNPNKKVHTAWLYNCFSIDIVKEKGLPMPIFIRGDDVEWGWRSSGQHHIALNGISIWHMAFAWRVSKVTDNYYSPRNMFFVNSLYTSNFKKRFADYFEARFKYLLKTYDYVSCNLYLQSMDDILKGGDAFRENPREQFEKVSQIGKVEYHDVEDLYEMWNVHTHRRKSGIGRKLLYLLTGRGLYCHKSLMKRRNISLEWYPPADNFMMVREVRVYNTNTKKCEIRCFDGKKLRNYKRMFYAKIKQIRRDYDKLHNDYVKSHKEFSSIEFWEKYLGLK